MVVSKNVERNLARISFEDAEINRALVRSAPASALLKDDHPTGFWFGFARNVGLGWKVVVPPGGSS